MLTEVPRRGVQTGPTVSRAKTPLGEAGGEACPVVHPNMHLLALEQASVGAPTEGLASTVHIQSHC